MCRSIRNINNDISLDSTDLHENPICQLASIISEFSLAYRVDFPSLQGQRFLSAEFVEVSVLDMPSPSPPVFSSGGLDGLLSHSLPQLLVAVLAFWSVE